jgi:hypothetical protein
VPPFSPSERVIVVGAGATRAASFPPAFTPECVPPLNADFFTQLQRISSKHQKLVRAVIADALELFGSNFSLTLEDYFTHLEFLTEAVAISPAGATFANGSLRDKRTRLMGALAAVLEMSTDVAIRRAGGCRLHAQLVKQLEPKDTVLSFNYDCVFDHALRTNAGGKWSTRHGYAFPGEYEIRGGEAWDADPAAAASTQSIHLLKLHGSLNWQLPGEDDEKVIQVKSRLHSQRGIPYFTVIPPVWNKSERNQGLFKILWRNAERAIRNAKHIAVVGFSFTPNDLHVESLFRVALTQGNLRTLVIANPSAPDRERIRAVFSRALDKKVLVRQYDDFENFVAAYPACFS